MISPAFKDLDQRNAIAHKDLAERASILKRRKTEDGSLPERLKKEFAIKSRLATRGVVDPLFIGLRDALVATNPEMKNLSDPRDGKFGATLDAKERFFVALYGLLAADNHEPLDFDWDFKSPTDHTIVPTTNDARFKRAIHAASGEYASDPELFEKTLAYVAQAGGNTVDAVKWVNVVRKLRARGVRADNPNLQLLTDQVLADEIGINDGAAPSSIDIDFPDLEDSSDLQIAANNILAMHILYPSWMLEEARFYDVYDKIEELFLNQMLPISRGSAGDRIFERWKKSTQRISKPERLNFYASCFGAPGGNPGLANQNNAFSDLWLRFVSGVSEWARKLQVDDLLRTRIPLSVSTEQVRKSARDLAANLSLHGYGVAYFAATELQKEINDIKEILSDEEVRMAYGARDMRQLIEQVSIYELGGARDVTRYFTMATSGAVITRWLAQKAPDLSGSYLRSILDIDEVRRETTRSPTSKATRNPTDRDLVDACEQWLAVTGTSDARVSEFAQPNETPAMTSRPVSIPQAAKDLLDSVGISAGMGAPGNGGTGRSRFASR